jgi:hypothetical protein
MTTEQYELKVRQQILLTVIEVQVGILEKLSERLEMERGVLAVYVADLKEVTAGIVKEEQL